MAGILNGLTSLNSFYVSVSTIVTTSLRVIIHISRPYLENLFKIFIINARVYLRIKFFENSKVSENYLESSALKFDNYVEEIKNLESKISGKKILGTIALGGATIYGGKKIYDYFTSDNDQVNPQNSFDITKVNNMNIINQGIRNILTELSNNNQYYNMLPTISSKYDPSNVITMEYINNNNDIINIYDALMKENTSFDIYGLK